MSLLESVILGIVEGITEFLPISSTAHLILTSKLLAIGQTEFLKSFEISIQLGAILAIVALYWRALFIDMAVLKRIVLAFVPTAILGGLLYKFIKAYLLSNTDVVLWALFIGGAVLIVFELLHREQGNAAGDIHSITYSKAFLIGIFQSCAMVPGVSRAAATIIGGMMMGIKRKTIVEFSFLLAVPTMLAASIYDLYKSADAFAGSDFSILFTGFVSSFVVAVIVVRFFLYFVEKHNFISAFTEYC
jgi:undecaprenyl-diphosphatase